MKNYYDYDFEYSKVTDAEFLESCKQYHLRNGRVTAKQLKCITRILGETQAHSFVTSLHQNPFQSDIEPQQETYPMTNLSDTFLAENENFKYISCVFAPYTGTKEYTYKTLLDIEANDFVVVQTPSKEYQVVQVRSIIDPLEFEPITGVRYKWVIQKLDTEQYDKCVAMEKEVNTKLRKAEVRKRQQELKESAAEFLDTEDMAKLVRL